MMHWVRNGHKRKEKKRKEKSHTHSLSLTNTHAHTKKKLTVYYFLQSFLAQIAQQLYSVVLKPKNQERGQWM